MEEKNKLYVGNLPYSVDNAALAELFAEYEVIDDGAQVIIDKFSGRSKGFGFVTLANQESAEKAVKEMNEKEIEGRKIVVNIARPMTERRDFNGGGNRFGGRR